MQFVLSGALSSTNIEFIIILYKQNPTPSIRRGKEGKQEKKGKKRERKKKGKSSVVAVLHPLGSDVRFIERKNEKKEEEEDEEAKTVKCPIETWSIQYISHTRTHVVSCLT